MPASKQSVWTLTAGKAALKEFLMSPSVLQWGIIVIPLAYFWFRLIQNLQANWITNPQYSYGLLVPFLCIGLLASRWYGFRGQRSENKSLEPKVEGQRSGGSCLWPVVLLFAFLAFLYLPTRLIEAAVPVWNPIQWLLAIETVGLTLCVIWLGLGRSWLRELAFPICFFLVAVPWPSLIEQPIIQGLTRMSAAIVVELLGWAGVPAVTHGNIIQVSTGMVGIAQACSGIRSFQSSLMISLFFGEFYRLSHGRRWLLVPLGFLFSMAFNICRMFMLTWIAADKGIKAISEYHDPAGITIAILCTFALWGLAALMKRPKAEGQRLKAVGGDQKSEVGGQGASSKLQVASSRLSFSALNRLMLCLVVWVAAVEAGVQMWYDSLDAHLKPGPAWTLNFPRNNPTFKPLPIDEKTRYLLRFDTGKQGAWTAANGTQWQAFYFTWLPGRVAGYLAKRHTPEICLTAEGLKMLSGPELTMMNIHGVVLPMRCYVFQTAEGLAQVFQCRWDAGAQEDDYVAHESARFNLIRAIWAGRGDKGQKVLEFVISGIDNPNQAKQMLIHELKKLIKVKGTGVKAENRNQRSVASRR